MKYFFILFLFISQFVSAQTYSGSWKFSYYGDIVKSTYHVNDGSHQEQISNSVIVPFTNGKGKTKVLESDNVATYVFDGKTISSMYYAYQNFKGFRISLEPGEKIFGTGERSIPMNRRGYKLQLNNNPWYGYSENADNLNYSVPFIISSKGYGIFFDNPARGYLDIGKLQSNTLEYGTTSGELTYYIIPGKDPDEIIRKYSSIVGTQPIPARWVFGNLMSRFGYRSEEQVSSILKKMEKEYIPVDAVILDLFWFGDSIKHTMGNLDWINKKAWPDPEDMIRKWKEAGVNTILITEPFVLNTTPNYEPSLKYHAVDSTGKPFVLTDFYFGNGGLLDIFRKDVQDWFWSKYKMQISKGVAGWWGDLGEPEKHPAAMYHNLKDLGFNRLFRSDEVHNIYGHYWDKMLFDKYAKEYPDVRLFNLNRSGYAGSPRYCVFPWSGDVSRSWEGLRAQLPLMMGMSLSGIPYIHSDAGGFAGGTGDPELYIRWMQFATFTPVFRPHGTALGDLEPSVKDIPSEAALYNEPYKSIAKNYIRLRYALLPYNYTLGYEQAKYGKPLVRPLFYKNNTDSNLYNITDEYMWGDNILVAPVLEKGAKERNVYLPEGKWYEFFSDQPVSKSKWMKVNVDSNNIPLFVKEGSFIPMYMLQNAPRSTSDYDSKFIGVKYYPSPKSSTYTMYDDDGKTNHTLEKGNYELITFKGKTINKKVLIDISSGGKIKLSRKIVFIVPGQKIVSVNNRPVTGSDYQINYSGKPVHLEIKLK